MSRKRELSQRYSGQMGIALSRTSTLGRPKDGEQVSTGVEHHEEKE